MFSDPGLVLGAIKVNDIRYSDYHYQSSFSIFKMVEPRMVLDILLKPEPQGIPDVT
jgi:hypothetical protein